MIVVGTVGLAAVLMTFPSVRQFGASLLHPARSAIQTAEAMMTVGLERAHAEFVGQGEGLAVVDFGLLDVWEIAVCSDGAEEAKGIAAMRSER